MLSQNDLLTRIEVKAALAKDVAVRQHNNRYSVGDLLLAILYSMIWGLERIETTTMLQANGMFRHLSGLPTYPDPSTLRRFLLRMAQRAADAVQSWEAPRSSARH